MIAAGATLVISGRAASVLREASSVRPAALEPSPSLPAGIPVSPIFLVPTNVLALGRGAALSQVARVILR
jgi:hypothetical protein